MKISIGNLPLKDVKADIFLHPIRVDKKDVIAYEPMAEEAVIALVAKYFAYERVPDYIKEYFDEMDDGYLFSESNFDEWDLERLEVGEIIVGRDILLHPRVENIKNFLIILRDFGGFKIRGIDLNNYFTPSDPVLEEILEVEEELNLEEIQELESFDGSVVYMCEDFDVVKDNEFLCSNQCVIANKIKSLRVEVDGEEKELKKREDLKGVFGVIYRVCDEYPFKRVKIRSL